MFTRSLKTKNLPTVHSSPQKTLLKMTPQSEQERLSAGLGGGRRATEPVGPLVGFL